MDSLLVAQAGFFPFSKTTFVVFYRVRSTELRLFILSYAGIHTVPNAMVPGVALSRQQYLIYCPQRYAKDTTVVGPPYKGTKQLNTSQFEDT